MHLLAEESVHVARPVSEVYDYVTDMERFGEWFPGVLSIVSADTRAHGETGKEYLETVVIPFRGQRRIRLVVREAQHDRLFVTEGKLPPLMPRMEVSFRAGEDDGCTVTWRMYSRNDSIPFRWTLLILARRVVRKRAAIGLAKLRTRLERECAPNLTV